MAGEQQLTKWIFSSNRDNRTYLSPLQLKATAELVAVSQLSSYQPAKPFLLVGHGSKPFSKNRGDEWSLRAFASMPSTAIFLRVRAEIKNLLCELARNAKIWGARASEHSFKFWEQIEQR